MGCGTSNTMDSVSPPKQVVTIPIPQVPPFPPLEAQQVELQVEGGEGKKEEERAMTAATVEEMKHEAMKHVPEGKGYLFGQSQNERKIVLLDCEKMQFSILSSKGQMPNTPNKYQPKDIIFEQSQQMLASNLFNKNSHPPYNFMFITFISDELIFLCGGVNFTFDYFSEEAFFFRVSSIESEQPGAKRKKYGNNLVGNKFEKLACMKQKRYSHMGAYFKTGRLGYIYVFGGRDEEDQLLDTCEQYSIEEKKWRDVTPMKTTRSTGFSLIFKSKIYIFGGYTADKKRSKSIDVYDPAKNYWETLNVKLHRGIQAGLIFSLKANQILLMGGNMQSGSLKSVIKINLAEQTYIWDSNMKNDRLLQKGVKFNESIFVFGGDFQDDFQKYNCKDRKWRDVQFSYNQFVSTEDINAYQMATETLEVNYDQSLLAKADTSLPNDFERYHIFGNDHFPCILQLNLNKFVLKKRPVPMALRLRSNMGVTKIIEGKYLICGGIDSLNQKPSKAAYIYYPGTNKAIEVAKLTEKKHSFAICSNTKFAYIFGGKNQHDQIINRCEKYSFDQDKWVQMPNLPTERVSAKAVMIGTKIFLFGGHDTLQNLTTIDMQVLPYISFDTQTNTFWQPKQSLSMSAQIKSVLLDNKNSKGVYIFSFNQVLNKHYCHHLIINVPQIDEHTLQQKIQQNFQVIKEVQQRELAVKVPGFAHGFAYGGKYYLLTAKGILSWSGGEEEKGFQSQIVINQVEMLQFPIERFSSI